MIAKLLKRWEVDFVREYRFMRTPFEYDFYIPAHHVFIEFHGRQHFEHVELFHPTKESFELAQQRDVFKRALAYRYYGRYIELTHEDLSAGKVEELLHAQLLPMGVLGRQGVGDMGDPPVASGFVVRGDRLDLA